MDFKQRIHAGQSGQYDGLNNGLNRINDYIFGVQRGTYTLIGGLSGSGKTTFVDFMILNAIEDADRKGININVFYDSFEIDEFTKRANWLSQIIYKKYDIVIPPSKINGFSKEKLTEDEKMLIYSEMEYLDYLFSKIKFNFDPINPTGSYKQWYDFISKRGTFEYEEYVDENNVKKQRIKKFTPDDPHEYNIIVSDHLGLYKRERGYTLKENIDKLSEYFITMRNLYGFSIIALQQFNQSLNSVERQKFKGVDLSPQQNDFKDSSNCYTDNKIIV